MKNDRNAMNHCDFIDSYPDGFVSFFGSFDPNISYSILPVTTATNKRSFSAHKYLKTYLRNTTKEVRLNGLALLYVHSDIGLNFEQVIADFLRKNRILNFN